MIVDVNGHEAHAATGGVDISGDGPVVVLLHGAGMDSTVWQLQTRYLAHRGMRALAVDLPAHGRSGGAPISSIEAMADWLDAFLEAAALKSAHLVGHSMGTFIALEVAKRFPHRALSLTLCGTATGMPVHPALIEAADNDLPAASALMAAWGHAAPAHVGVNPTPGMWMLGGARALVENSRPGVLACDFRACQAYEGAVAAATEVTCPATVVIGLGDKMTPPKGGRSLAAVMPRATVVELPGTGHSMMTENPGAVKRSVIDTVSRAAGVA